MAIVYMHENPAAYHIRSLNRRQQRIFLLATIALLLRFTVMPFLLPAAQFESGGPVLSKAADHYNHPSAKQLFVTKTAKKMAKKVTVTLDSLSAEDDDTWSTPLASVFMAAFQYPPAPPDRQSRPKPP